MTAWAWFLLTCTAAGLGAMPFMHEYTRAERVRMALAYLGAGASALAWELHRVHGALLLAAMCLWYFLSVLLPVIARRGRARLEERRAKGA